MAINHKKLKKEELIELVTKIMNCDGNENEIQAMIVQFKKNVPHPSTSNLIYWDELSPEEVVDKALSYKPILL